MRVLLVTLGIVLAAAAPRGTSVPVAAPNPNTVRAGTLSDGVLRITLEARRVMWYPNGDSLPGRETTAFSEPGKPPMIPGPFIRVPAGTALHITVRNIDVPDTLRFAVPFVTLGDSAPIPPGATRDVHLAAATPGNFFYRAYGTGVLGAGLQIQGLLAGALVVDAPGTSPRPNERVFVLNWSIDRLDASGAAPDFQRSVFAINGLSWPHTERISATVGDSLRWRIINLNVDIHPIHLHGFYFRVDEYAALLPPRDGQDRAGRMVVTERMPGFSRMTITWVPERAGNWLAHCHFALHLVPPRILEVASLAALAPNAESTSHAGGHANHAMTGMAGLVMGVKVSPRPGERLAEPERGRRQLRLVAVQDTGFPDTLPSLRFRLEERGKPASDAGSGFSPPIVLQRGEPVSITVVNTLREPTAVHWHGIELESYFDGVAGFGGRDGRISPIIAPRDSFEARFTPPRAGTFIYHSHINEVRQHAAGMVGSLVVVDSASAMGSDDHVFLIKAARNSPVGGVLEINGQMNPDTVTLQAGRPARLRFIGLTAVNPNATIWLTSRTDSVFANRPDSLVVQWMPVAKDGADLPSDARRPRLARQIISMGETYDFEFTPPARGAMRIEVRGAGANAGLLVRVPLRVQ